MEREGKKCSKNRKRSGIKWMNRRREREGRMTGYKRINTKKVNKVILCHICPCFVEKKKHHYANACNHDPVGFQRRVHRRSHDVSEEHIASIFKVED
jgi:hypothetical protein